jgi:hypothetical protein
MNESDIAKPNPAGDEEKPSKFHWYHKVSALLFILFCLEVGLFLIVFPWTERWDDNLFATFLSSSIPHWSEYWQSSYLRGAVSGIGVVDLFICLSEIFRLRRFSQD